MKGSAAKVLTGAVVSMARGQAPLDQGAVYIRSDGIIVAIQPASDPAPSGFEGAPRIETHGTIFPGLIELHEHLVFASVPLWTPPVETYPSRYVWPLDARYDADIGRPAALLGLLAGEELLAYAQLKCLVGGVTTVQGSVRTTHPGHGWFLRDVEHETLGGRLVPAVSLVGAVTHADLTAARTSSDGRLICHLAEGVDPGLRAELRTVEDAGYLGPDFIGIHANALTADDFNRWGRLGGTLVWSPFTNLWLYGRTADVLTAREAGLRICLGSDWSPTGTKSLLGELKVARHLNTSSLEEAFSAEDLCAMVTRTPAEALGWEQHLGTLAAGRRADITVVRRRAGDYADLIAAWEDDVMLVLVDGLPLYGDTSLLTELTDMAQLEPFGANHSVVVGQRAMPSPGSTFAALESVRLDPVAAREGWAHRHFAILPAIPVAGIDNYAPPSEALLTNTHFPVLDTMRHDAAFHEKVSARMPELASPFRHLHQEELS